VDGPYRAPERQCLKTLISGGGGIYAVHAGVVKSLYY
jgi:hypothetical protein